jgi:hypothetical protein
VYTTGDSTIGEGTVTMVEPTTASADEALAAEARLVDEAADGVSAERRPAFNDEMVVIVRALLFSVDCGHLRDDRPRRRYIVGKLKIFKLITGLVETHCETASRKAARAKQTGWTLAGNIASRVTWRALANPVA